MYRIERAMTRNENKHYTIYLDIVVLPITQCRPIQKNRNQHWKHATNKKEIHLKKKRFNCREKSSLNKIFYSVVLLVAVSQHVYN